MDTLGYELRPSDDKRPVDDILLDAAHLQSFGLFQYLVEQKHLDIKKARLYNGLDLLTQSENDKHELAITKYLLDHGFDPNEEIQFKKTKIAFAESFEDSAAEMGMPSIIREFKEQSRLRDIYSGLPLLRVIIDGDVERTKLYLEYGADPFKKNINGRNAFDAVQDLTIVPSVASKQEDTLKGLLQSYHSHPQPAVPARYVN